jgi:hypothetical protein
MMTSVVAGNSTLQVPYDFPPGMVSVRVVAQQPIYVYVVNADGRAAYMAGTPFTSYGGSLAGQAPRRDYALRMILPPRAQWFLLLKNPALFAMPVSYDASHRSIAPRVVVPRCRLDS